MRAVCRRRCAARGAAIAATMFVFLLPAGRAAALSISVLTPPSNMTITHGTPGTASTTVSFTLGLLSTLTIRDASGTTPGFMDKVDCSTRAALGGSLGNRLQWSSPEGLTSGSLNGSDQIVWVGILSIGGKVHINYSQPLGSSEAVTAGDCYEVPVTLTIT